MKKIKNSISRILQNRKKGATSLFITIIVVILFGVITLGFTRLIISEANQTTNSDLSQSAYDAAMAGVEDAKLAVQQYQFCLSEGKSNVSGCAEIVSDMEKGIKEQSCDTVKNVLNRQSDSENGVTVQEVQSSNVSGSSSTDNGAAASMLQAYTCVTIEEDLADYRTTLNAENSTRIIPLRAGDSGINGTVNDLDYIDIEWFSERNAAKLGGNLRWTSGVVLPAGGNTRPEPPIISMKLYQADSTFSLSELSTARGDGEGTNYGTDRSSLYLKPVQGSSNVSNNTISRTLVSEEADKHGTTKTENSGHANEIYTINCGGSYMTADGFYCKARIYIPNTFRNTARNTGASFLVVSLPYGEPDTDFSVSLGNTNNQTVDFQSVQVRVDSTGRANDLYRRIETRLETVDTYYPYPEYEIQMSNSDVNDLTKRFRTSRNCWYADYGTSASCSDYSVI